MLKILKNASWLALGVAVTVLVAAGSSGAKVKGNTIIFGAAVSFTGKYSTAGKHTKNGYELAVKRINEMGRRQRRRQKISNQGQILRR